MSAFLNWAHVAILAEWFAFFLVTPQFLGGTGIMYVTAILRRGAFVLVILPDLLALRPVPDTEPDEAFAVIQRFIARMREGWGRQTFRTIFFAILYAMILPAPILIVTSLLLSVGYRWIAAGIFIIGYANLMLLFRPRGRPRGFLSPGFSN